MTVFGILNLVAPLVTAGLMGFLIYALKTHPRPPSPVLEAPGVRAIYLAAGVSLMLTGGLMFGCGWALLRRSHLALRWVNLYGLISVLTKAAYLVLSILVLIPARLSMRSEIIASGGKVSSHGSQLFGSLFITAVPAIYPLLALILLNQPQVKRWFNQSAR